MNGFLGMTLALAVLAGVLIARKLRNHAWFDRLLLAAVPSLTTFLAWDVALRIANEPGFAWNNIRLARTFALFHGVTLYPGRDALGPIVGTLHPPLSQMLYWPAIFASTPMNAVRIASSISVALIFLPLLWVYFSAHAHSVRNFAAAAAGLFACLSMLMAGSTIEGFRYCAFHVHTDSAELGFATLAAGLLYMGGKSIGWKRLLLSALFSTLALGCKQTMAPFLLAMMVYLFMSYGARVAARYAIYLCIGGLLYLFTLVSIWPARDLYFNLITLAAHRPSTGPFLFRLWRTTGTSVRYGWQAVLCLLLLSNVLLRQKRTGKTWRSIFAEHRWLVFVLAGVFLIPGGIKARMTVGGDTNHLGCFCYFLAVGATLGLVHFMKEERKSVLQWAARSLAVLLILIGLPGIGEAIGSSRFFLRRADSELSQAYRYEKNHPGKAYFANFPLAVYYAEGRFDHFDHSLDDRELAGYPISRQQLLSGLPRNIQLIAYPRSWPISETLKGYLAGFHPIDDPELPGWIVWQRPAVAAGNPR